MNNRELERCLSRGAIGEKEDNLQVVVETQNGGCPTRYMSEVTWAGRGFDWTAGLFLIRPKDPLVVARVLTSSIRQAAEERLARAKEVHDKLGFKYIMKARENEWLEGFIEGVRMHITSCTEDPK